MTEPLKVEDVPFGLLIHEIILVLASVGTGGRGMNMLQFVVYQFLHAKRV